jgi:hypothetical protein
VSRGKGGGERRCEANWEDRLREREDVVGSPGRRGVEEDMRRA